MLHAFDLFPDVQYVFPEELDVFLVHIYGITVVQDADPDVLNMFALSALKLLCNRTPACVDHIPPSRV